ncbi:pyridoxine/pyridoxamine 5'-phosphate oxidase-like [Ciona intestinalis]
MFSSCYKFSSKLNQRYFYTNYPINFIAGLNNCKEMNQNKVSIFDVKDKDTNPFDLFKEWFDAAKDAGVVQPDAMVLSTVKSDHTPSSRFVLLSGFDENGFCFRTNYSSDKASAIEKNPNVSLAFYWNLIRHSVRIEGTAEKLSSEESDKCFNNLPESFQIGLHVGEHQSSVIANRKVMEDKMDKLTKELSGKKLTRPNFWGGYVVKPKSIEFWKGHRDWIADRILFTKEVGNQGWKIQRLTS